MGLALLGGVLLLSGAAEAPSKLSGASPLYPRLFSYRETTTTTSPPIAMATPPARQGVTRASRSRRPRPEPPVTEVASLTGDCNAWGWRRSYADNDRCWRGWLAQWSDWDVDRMLRIIWCESHGDPWAKGGKHIGLLQIAGAYDLQGNGPAQISLGHQIWLRQGYGAWQCRG